MRCPECGRETLGPRFCEHCGALLAESALPRPERVAPATPQRGAPRASRGPLAWIIAAVGGLVLVLVCVALVALAGVAGSVLSRLAGETERATQAVTPSGAATPEATAPSSQPPPPSTSTSTPSPEATVQMMESSRGSIAAFAEDWWWSEDRNQDGRYGESRINLHLGGRRVETATLHLRASYSQQSGGAEGVVYISISQQVQPTDADHDKGAYWYGNTISPLAQVGAFTCTYGGADYSFDITDFLKRNSLADTFYVAVENKAVADIGIGSIYIEAKVR